MLTRSSWGYSISWIQMMTVTLLSETSRSQTSSMCFRLSVTRKTSTKCEPTLAMSTSTFFIADSGSLIQITTSWLIRRTSRGTRDTLFRVKQLIVFSTRFPASLSQARRARWAMKTSYGSCFQRRIRLRWERCSTGIKLSIWTRMERSLHMKWTTSMKNRSTDWSTWITNRSCL